MQPNADRVPPAPRDAAQPDSPGSTLVSTPFGPPAATAAYAESNHSSADIASSATGGKR